MTFLLESTQQGTLPEAKISTTSKDLNNIPNLAILFSYIICHLCKKNTTLIQIFTE